MVNVGRKTEVRIAAALVRRHHQLSVIYLELHEAEARSLIRLRVSGAEEQHVVLAAALLAVDLLNQPRQLLKVCRIAVDEDSAAVVPPGDSRLAVFLNVALALHEERQFAAELLARDAVGLEYVEQIARHQSKALVQEVANVSLLVGLFFALLKNLSEDGVVLVLHSKSVVLRFRYGAFPKNL